MHSLPKIFRHNANRDRSAYSHGRPSVRGRDPLPPAATLEAAVGRQSTSARAPPPPPAAAVAAPSGGPRSLSEVVGNRVPSQASSPFATDHTAESLRAFDDLERQLTASMTEKSSLDEELSRSDH